MKEIIMDIHAHIIPGVDDGSTSMEETMRMIGQAHDEGICAIIATPHYGIVNCGYDSKNAVNIYHQLVERVKIDYPDMTIIMGNEIYYTQGIVEDLIDGKARCLGNTSYALVEFNIWSEFEAIKSAIDEFTLNGFRPIIAHLERYECLKNNIELVEELISRGAYVQINCRSITGSGNEIEKRTSWSLELLERGLVHFIASDCHNDNKRRPIYRDAVKCMIEYVGVSETKRIVKSNIISLIKNEKIS